MVFGSPLFLFVFVPVALLGYYLIGRTRHGRLVVVWLTAVSLWFYGSHNPIYVLLIVGSILCNYVLGSIVINQKSVSKRKLALLAGIMVNIILLGYFKYANFLIGNALTLLGSDSLLTTMVLPLAISFFTLQQIAYLVDAYRGETIEHSFIDYCLFVTFFPKLISGPIVRLREIMPQITKNHMPPITKERISVGLTVLFLGLFKKVILADNIGVHADLVFHAASLGNTISFVDAWIGALAYTFQLYFDFSGYCDMAIGISLMLGIRLPLNFYSPYKATSIIDFWRRWHMTLSRFARDYLYIPLGGNRRGMVRQMLNLLAVMVIIGFWHGAGWTFVAWGALHGLYLVMNHSWRRLRRKSGQHSRNRMAWGTRASVLLTFIAVAVAWVLFRADTFATATEILKGMIGMNGLVLPISAHDMLGVLGPLLESIGVAFTGLVTSSPVSAMIWLVVSITVCWFLPNVQEYMSNYRPALDTLAGEAKTYRSLMRWAPSFWRSAIVAGMATMAVLGLAQVSEFIYFQF